jgi:hypothetical protein
VGYEVVQLAAGRRYKSSWQGEIVIRGEATLADVVRYAFEANGKVYTVAYSVPAERAREYVDLFEKSVTSLRLAG